MQVAPTKQTAEINGSEKGERRARVAVAIALIALPLIYFYPAVTGKILLAPGDGWSQIFGIRVLIGQMLRDGQLPLWNPFIFGGMPLMASIQPGALYPPTWLFAIFTPKIAMNLMVLTTYHLALIGTYFFARKIGCNRVGALVAGMTFAFGGYMVAHLGHTNRVAAAAWLPWILLAVEMLYQRARWGWVALGSWFIALQLFAGEPQMNLYTILLVSAYSLYSLLVREERETRARFFLSALAMAVCGALLSMIELLPAREFLSYGDRSGIDYEYFSQFAFPPKQVFSLFFPYFFGGAATAPYRVFYWGEWGLTETAGYVGLTTWLLAFVAIWSRKVEKKQIGFWTVYAVIALLLAFGRYLPFEINQALFHLPVYKLFRASGRHLFEFTFALGILAGFGVTYLQKVREKWPALLKRSSLLLGAIVSCCAVVYLYFDKSLVGALPLPDKAGQASNPEFYLPLACFVFALIASWLYGWKPAKLGWVVVAIVLLDLMTWGFFYEWRWQNFNFAQRIADPPAVEFIKRQESEQQSFRILSQSPQPYEKNVDALNYPNISILRGLQSLNGYDPLRFLRLAQVTGGMTLDGLIAEASAFNPEHKGFDLLNVKYLLRERPPKTNEINNVSRQGIPFAETPLSLTFATGARTELDAKATATELALVTAMGSSDDLTDGQPILRVTLHTTTGQIIERELQAGRDTSEWAYDRSDVKARIKHKRAEVVESWSAGEFEGHRYLAHLRFPRVEIDRIVIAHADGTNAEITISRASLYDAQTREAKPLGQYALPSERWRKLQDFGAVELYENLRRMPRAWFVQGAEILPSNQVLQTIKTGRLPDGRAYEPAKLALLEREDFGSRAPVPPPIGEVLGSQVTVTRYEPQRIVLQAKNPQAGLLVLSEVFYRGWEAWVDGKRIPVKRVNYLLRGLALPPGDHQVVFVFKAHSFRTGAVYSGIGLLLLAIGAFISGTQKGRGLMASLTQYVGAAQGEKQGSPSSFFARLQTADWIFSVKRRLKGMSEVNVVLLLIAVLGAASLWLIYSRNLASEPIRSDGVGYYLYLPSILLHHTYKMEVVGRAQYGEQFEESAGLRRYNEKGNYLNRYALGEAVLLSPFFLLGHIWAWLVNAPLTGFSWPYQFAAAISGLFYAVAGLYVLKLILLQHFSVRTVSLTLIVITLATNLFHYATYDNIFSHIYSFFLFNTLLFLIPRWHAEPSWKNTSWVALVAGLITIVRPTNSLFFIFVPLLGVANLEGLRARAEWVWAERMKCCVGILVYLCVVFPLLLYWKVVTNHWIVNSYQGVPFYWLNPELLNVLFSVKKGLFFWSPILLLAIAGWWRVSPHWRGFTLPALLFFLAQLYLVASWGSWWFGGSFGHRAFTEMSGIFAVGYACVLERTRDRSWGRWLVLIISGVAILLSVKLMLQYWLGAVPYEGPTTQQFSRLFFQLPKWR